MTDGHRDNSVGERKLIWDEVIGLPLCLSEEYRLLAVDDNGLAYARFRLRSVMSKRGLTLRSLSRKVVSNYWYDADGERTVKTSGESDQVYVNGVFSDGSTNTAKFSLYVSPYLVANQGGRYTKHIYAGSQRIVTKVGDFASYGSDPRRIEYAGANTDGLSVDYKSKYAAQQVIKDNYKFFDVPYNGTDNDNYADGEGFYCNDGSMEAAVAQARKAQTRAVSRSFKVLDNYENVQFFYHPDHLGSSSFITNLDGEVVQHIKYVPFGEVFIEERNNLWNTPYLFNAKEFDEETGLYYYGGRYYDSKISIWISTDPSQEKYADITSYCYTFNNPIRFIDPDGFDPTPYPKEKLGDPDYYRWRAQDFRKQNPNSPVPDYYMEYGDKYIRRFTYKTSRKLSKAGQKWLQEVRYNLQVAIEDELVRNPEIELQNGGTDFRTFAFESHVEAYWNDSQPGSAPLHSLPVLDLFNILLTPDLKDLLQTDGRNQVAKMVDRFVDYSMNNPMFVVEKGFYAYIHKSQIVSLLKQKMAKECLKLVDLPASIVEVMEVLNIDLE